MTENARETLKATFNTKGGYYYYLFNMAIQMLQMDLSRRMRN